MRTIIPFPRIRLLGAAGEVNTRTPSTPDPAPLLPVTRVPEGEPSASVSDLSLPPRARAIHDNIIALIQSVHGRFG